VESLASHGAVVHTCARTATDVAAAVAEWKAAGLHVTGSVCDVACATSRGKLATEAGLHAHSRVSAWLHGPSVPAVIT
jgi:NAD(P)-dependent dehydrogenase (short-subunit alcohol dehydrogenase family)